MSSCLSLRPPNAAVISPACVCGHIQFVPPNVCVSSPGAAITSFVSFETHAAPDTVDEYRLLTLITGSRERQKKHKKNGAAGPVFLEDVSSFILSFAFYLQLIVTVFPVVTTLSPVIIQSVQEIVQKVFCFRKLRKLANPPVCVC